MSLLEVHNLQKTYGDLTAVDRLSFSVESGELFGLLGPNGAGKSTTMMMLAGLVPADSGTIRLDGAELKPSDRHSRRLMGMVPQELAIYPNLTGRENLQFFGRLYGVRGAELNDRVADVLEQIGLTDRANDHTGIYSGGMKRRLNFGAALLHRPRLLLLDEPTVGVDPQSRAHLLNCVRRLATDGLAVVYCSHYMEEVQDLCDRVAIIDRGRLLACDHIGRLLGRIGGEVRLILQNVSANLRQQLDRIDGVRLQERDGAVVVTIPNPADADESPRKSAGGEGEADAGEKEGRLLAALTAVLSAVSDGDGRLADVESDEPDLERLFLQMTGSRLRD